MMAVFALAPFAQMRVSRVVARDSSSATFRLVFAKNPRPARATSIVLAVASVISDGAKSLALMTSSAERASPVLTMVTAEALVAV